MKRILVISICLLPLYAAAQEVRYFDKFFIMMDKNKTGFERRYTLDVTNRTATVEDYSFNLKQATGTIHGLTTIDEVDSFLKYARNDASPFHYKPEFENVRGEFTRYKKNESPEAHYFVKANRVIYSQVWDETGIPRLINGTGQYDRKGDDGGSLYVEAFSDSILDERYKVRLSERDTIYSKVDKPAEPKGGIQKFYAELLKKMRYPVFAQLAGKEGVVLMNFVVDKTGKLVEFKPLAPDGSVFEKKTMQKFEDLPAWNPAVFKGKNVKVDYTLPVRFKLD